METSILRSSLTKGIPLLALTINPPIVKQSHFSLSPYFINSLSDNLCEAVRSSVNSSLIHAVKIETPYYEAYGPAGFKLIETVRSVIPSNIAFIVDCMRGDIANTASAYARAFFVYYKADGVTVSAYMGRDAIKPFLSHSRDVSVFVECRPARAEGLASLTSIASCEDKESTSVNIYQHVARLCRDIRNDTQKEETGVLGVRAAAREAEDGGSIGLLHNDFYELPLLVNVEGNLPDVCCHYKRRRERPMGDGGSLLLCLTPSSLEESISLLQQAHKTLSDFFPDVYPSA